MIRKIREENRITLRGLAQKIDLSASFLSQVENGKTYPSLQSLKRIADTLNTTVGELIGEKGSITNTTPVVEAGKRKTLKNLGKGVEIQFLSSLDRGHYMEPAIHRMEPHSISGYPLYQHKGQEFMYVLNDCVIELTLANEVYKLEGGDCIYFDSNLPHSFKNISNKVAEVLCVSSPPYF